MIAYPNLVDAIAGRDLEELAEVADVDATELEQLVAGGWAAAPATRRALAEALGVPVGELFALAPELEQALAGAPSRFVTDPSALRQADRGAA